MHSNNISRCDASAQMYDNTRRTSAIAAVVVAVAQVGAAALGAFGNPVWRSPHNTHPSTLAVNASL
jgi:hypothetical protein